MYTEADYAPLLTKHNIEAEAEHLAKYLNQDVWVITRLLRDYWKDKLAVEWTIEDIRKAAYPFPDFTNEDTLEDTLEVLKNTAYEYSRSWSITVDGIEHSIEIYSDCKQRGFKDEDESVVKK
jgi:hypothetical protein